MNDVTTATPARAILAAALLGTVAFSFHVAAQQPTAAQGNAIRAACRADYQANCASVPTGGAAALACLQQNASRTSAACRQALSAVDSAAPAAAKASAEAAGAAAATGPHRITGDGGSALVYQPQVVA